MQGANMEIFFQGPFRCQQFNGHRFCKIRRRQPLIGTIRKELQHPQLVICKRHNNTPIFDPIIARPPSHEKGERAWTTIKGRAER